MKHYTTKAAIRNLWHISSNLIVTMSYERRLEVLYKLDSH